MSDCIVSIGVSGWYPKGIQRLRESLQHRWRGDVHLLTEYPPGCPTHREQPYGFKLWAINNARQRGYDRILWLDSSAWAIGDPAPVFDIAREQGHYFWTSAYWSHQWCNDASLKYFGYTRDEAENIEMLYALVMCLDFTHERTQEFMRLWQKSLDDGMFKGSWKREEEDEEDDRYLGHRHDQTCATLIAHKLGMKLDSTHTLCHLYEPDMPDTVRLVFQGM